MKKIARALVFVIFVGMFVDGDIYGAPITGRIWNYNIITSLISKKTGIITISGFKYEYMRYLNGESLKPKKMLVYEFFLGPYYKMHIGKIGVILPVVYHWMGFPDIPASSDFSFNHNIDIFPSFFYKMGNSIFQWRIFFHNTFYSTIYKYIPNVGEPESGYSLLIKLRGRYSYRISKRVALTIGDEFLYGLIGNNGLPAKTGPGFTEKGIDGNRIMAGFSITLRKGLVLLPYYLYETTYGENKQTGKKEITLKSHHLSLILKYNFKT